MRARHFILIRRGTLRDVMVAIIVARSTLGSLCHRLSLKRVLDNARQLELLLVHFTNVRDAAARQIKLILFDQVVCHVFELSIRWVEKVGGNRDTIVWLQGKREKLIIYDDNLA